MLKVAKLSICIKHEPARFHNPTGEPGGHELAAGESADPGLAEPGRKEPVLDAGGLDRTFWSCERLAGITAGVVSHRVSPDAGSDWLEGILLMAADVILGAGM
jgi:hypothetical protein